jgi:hypothetical protein
MPCPAEIDPPRLPTAAWTIALIGAACAARQAAGATPAGACTLGCRRPSPRWLKSMTSVRRPISPIGRRFDRHHLRSGVTPGCWRALGFFAPKGVHHGPRHPWRRRARFPCCFKPPCPADGRIQAALVAPEALLKFLPRVFGARLPPHHADAHQCISTCGNQNAPLLCRAAAAR